jgi:hypothetical protein
LPPPAGTGNARYFDSAKSFAPGPEYFDDWVEYATSQNVQEWVRIPNTNNINTRVPGPRLAIGGIPYGLLGSGVDIGGTAAASQNLRSNTYIDYSGNFFTRAYFIPSIIGGALNLSPAGFPNTVTGQGIFCERDDAVLPRDRFMTGISNRLPTCTNRVPMTCPPGQRLIGYSGTTLNCIPVVRCPETTVQCPLDLASGGGNSGVTLNLPFGQPATTFNLVAPNPPHTYRADFSCNIIPGTTTAQWSAPFNETGSCQALCPIIAPTPQPLLVDCDTLPPPGIPGGPPGLFAGQFTVTSGGQTASCTVPPSTDDSGTECTCSRPPITITTTTPCPAGTVGGPITTTATYACPPGFPNYASTVIVPITNTTGSCSCVVGTRETQNVACPSGATGNYQQERFVTACSPSGPTAWTPWTDVSGSGINELCVCTASTGTPVPTGIPCPPGQVGTNFETTNVTCVGNTPTVSVLPSNTCVPAVYRWVVPPGATPTSISGVSVGKRAGDLCSAGDTSGPCWRSVAGKYRNFTCNCVLQN